MVDVLKKYKFSRYSREGIQEAPEEILVESSLELWLEDMMLSKFSCSPGLQEQLAIGYLITSGLITRIEDVELLSIESGSIIVSSQNKTELIRKFLHLQTQNTPLLYPIADSKINVHLSDITESLAQLQKQQSLHKRTGGAHGALLFSPESGENLIVEDIGRLNSMDKIIGLALGKEWSLTHSVIIVTGRLTSEMVIKAVNARIPMLCSLAIATDKGIAIAEENNLTLVGSLKPVSFWVYNQGAVKLQ
ncbi:MAG: hypothetical protein BAJATHORv1_10397 [Candidatus Thorarchaeota archaeon]|nr:MAG: hypothetical protein BAJATHORv1_10397 [Candidatus Thorarchaeota archaeon]